MNREQATIARRCMEQFLLEMRRCSIEDCSKDDRVDIAKSYLSRFDQFPDTPLMQRMKELLSSIIDGKSHAFDTYIHEQVGDSSDMGSEWLCSVCGKKNRDAKRKYTECNTCGRPKGYSVSKKLKKLNECNIDPTPHLTNATKAEIQMIKVKNAYSHREPWIGEEGKKSVFTSTTHDFEALERKSIKSEIDDVLTSIRQSLNESVPRDK